MTNVPPPSPRSDPVGDDTDLLASLYLDDEASEAERARVEADPQLLALVESLRATAGALAALEPPAGLRALQIGAALDSFDEQHRPIAADFEASITSMSNHRTRRTGPPAWIGAAAVATLIVGGLGFVAASNGDDDDSAEIATSDTMSRASSSNRDADATAAIGDEPDGESMVTESMQTEALAPQADESMEEEASDDFAGDASLQDAAAFYAERGPIDLADYEGDTAPDYAEQFIATLPAQPITEAPCADSPVLAERLDVDSFYPVIFNGQPASLILQDGAPATALIIGSTCEIEQV